METIRISMMVSTVFFSRVSNDKESSFAACSVRKGLNCLMWLHDVVGVVMKVSWTSMITPRFLAELDGIIVDEPRWVVKFCCTVRVAGK